jgi:putative ABC transport system permease protein
MTAALYMRLARMNIRNNRKIYLPYILTCVGMVMMFYIVSFLATDREVGRMAGGGMLQTILGFGMGVIAVFALVFLFYSNSFLMKRRKKELGLYNMLGMGKRHIAQVLLWESAMVAAVSLFSGLAAGILFSKFSQLAMLRLVDKPASFDFRVSSFAVIVTLALFAGFFFLILLNSLRQVRFSSAMELLRSGSAGEREPRANYVLAVLGAILLGAGYWLALTVVNPIEALLWFFVAVILVILGTYLLFISGSVALLKLLRRNKRYYYRTNHFVSVSGMFYRMKRNGAGLASICILSTMVLVMISSTTCLYVGADDALRERFPRNISVATDTQSPETPPAVEAAAAKALSGAGVAAENLLSYCYLSFSATLEGEALEIGGGADGLARAAGAHCRVYVVPAADYEAVSGRSLNLGDGEIAAFPKGMSVGGNLVIGGRRYRVREVLDAFEGDETEATDVTGSVYVFVKDAEMRALYDAQKQVFGKNASDYNHYYGFDLPLDRAAQAALAAALRAELKEASPISQVQSAAESWDDFLSLYGGLLFLGLLLGLTFILAAVLIMYYKQVTEGYEDNERFDILKKVGMTGREVRKTINSQVLTVFSLPLAAAAVHLAFAFPMVSKLLQVFNLANVPLFMAVTGATIALFALFYVGAYLVTSRAYLAIVGGMNGRLYL